MPLKSAIQSINQSSKQASNLLYLFASLLLKELTKGSSNTGIFDFEENISYLKKKKKKKERTYLRV